ncbi:MAG: T9SS type A sorting domain-containing protein [Bacteroidetes bacterium]|nr:T9SS type A sorting domain-containing protein [Bacteroidota bacterium]MCL2303194.1 T9SS type A sorting domain-containing protein [Lentimicrobiaceae bacterium]
MKKILLVLCCSALVVLGMAQPKTERISDKFAGKFKYEKLTKKIDLEKEKLSFFQKQISLSQMQNPTKSQKNADWWEPDTIYQYYGDGNTNELRRIFSYTNGICTGELWQWWEMNQWNISGKITHSYDPHNNKIETLFQSWEETQWENSMRYLYKYDAQNNMTEKVFQFWEGYWFSEEMITYAYDSQNRMIEKMIYSWWGEDELEFDDKIVYKYNEQNNIIEERHQYPEEDDEWYDHVIIVYSYDAQNQLTGAMLQILDDVWEETVKLTVVYDLQNNTITHIYDFRDWESGQWFGVMKIIYTYDSQNNLLSESLQEGEDGEWEEYERYTYSYDENNNAIDGYLWENYKKGFIWDWEEGQIELTVYYNNMQSSLRTFQFNRFKATYMKPEVGIKENHLLKNSVKLFPNPVSSILYIETSNAITPEVKIYSIQGVLLINAKGNQIDVSSLPSGIYITEVNGICRKIVKQ